MKDKAKKANKESKAMKQCANIETSNNQRESLIGIRVILVWEGSRLLKKIIDRARRSLEIAF